jgi:hypothetical protein
MLGVILLMNASAICEEKLNCAGICSTLDELKDIKDEPTKQAILGKYDLSDPGFSKFMVEQFNSEYYYPGVVLAILIRFKPEQGLAWIFDNYEKLNLCGRSQVSISPDCVEKYGFYIHRLGDKAASVDPHMEPFPGKAPLRICDNACQYLAHAIFPKDSALRQICTPQLFSSIKERDKAIANFLEWWKANSAEFLKKQPSLIEKYPKLKEPYEKFLKVLEVPKEDGKSK